MKKTNRIEPAISLFDFMEQRYGELLKNPPVASPEDMVAIRRNRVDPLKAAATAQQQGAADRNDPFAARRVLSHIRSGHHSIGDYAVTFRRENRMLDFPLPNQDPEYSVLVPTKMARP